MGTGGTRLAKWRTGGPEQELELKQELKQGPTDQSEQQLKEDPEQAQQHELEQGLKQRALQDRSRNHSRNWRPEEPEQHSEAWRISAASAAPRIQSMIYPEQRSEQEHKETRGTIARI